MGFSSDSVSVDAADRRLSASGRPLSKNWLAVISFIWAGQAISMFTSYAASFAAVWYVTETTGSAVLLSAMSICAYLPQGILSPYGGVIADRYNRKAVIIAADMAVGLVSLALGLFILFGNVSIAAIMVMVVVRSAGQAFHGPAMMAAMPMLVPEKHLLRINTLDMMLMSVAGIVSPALGIVLYEGIGFHAVMFFDFAGAVLACLALAKASIPSVHAEADACEKRHPLSEMKEGWDALRANRGLFLLIIMITLGMVSFGPMGSLYPLMTYDHFGGDGFMAAVAESTFAGGLFAGSLVIMAWGGGKRLALLLAVSCVLFGALAAVSGLLAPSMFWVFAILCVLMGMVCAWFNGPTVTLVQRNVSEEKMGRALGFVAAAMGLASPVGIAVGGIAAEAIGVAPFFVIDGIVCALIGVALYLPKSVRALDAPPAVDDAVAASLDESAR
ncbi:MAG: MFS transporter [Slackia sp.]|nr:MFS transporter [Slackia sp.]